MDSKKAIGECQLKKFENCADFIADEENKAKMIDKRLLKEYNRMLAAEAAKNDVA